MLTATVRDGGTWEKQGRRGGKLVFTETIAEYRDQHGELVVTARGVGVRTEKVVDRGADDGLTCKRGSTTPVSSCWSDDLTRTQIVQYAGASGDYNPLHTDEASRREVAGYPSVFAHGMLTMGMTGRVLTDWFGVEALTALRRALRQAGVAGRHPHGDGHGHRRSATRTAAAWPTSPSRPSTRTARPSSPERQPLV